MPARPASGLTAPFGDVIAVAVIVLFAVLPYPESVFQVPGMLLPIALLPAAAMPFRRRWPLAVLGVSVVVAVVLSVMGILSPSSLIATAISAFAVTAYTRRTVGLIALTLVVGVVFVSNAVPLHGEFFDSRALQFLFFIALAGAIGDATRSRREFGAAMTERAERAERGREEEARRRVAEERVRIARDLHDVVAHQITVISLNAGVASSALESRPDRAREALTTIRRASRTVLTDIGGLMALLRSEDPEDTGDLRPQTGLAGAADLIARFVDAGLRVELHDESAGVALSPSNDHVAYLVLLEGLTNAHKHGADRPVRVRLDVVSGDLLIDVRNEVRAGPEASAGGHGLVGLRERVTAVRGTVRTESVDGVFRLDVRLPTDGGSDEWSA